MGRAGSLALFLRQQRLLQQPVKLLYHQLFVAQLRAVGLVRELQIPILCNAVTQVLLHQLLLFLRQQVGVLNMEPERNPALDFIHVLPSCTAAAGSLEREFGVEVAGFQSTGNNYSEGEEIRITRTAFSVTTTRLFSSKVAYCSKSVSKIAILFTLLSS